MDYEARLREATDEPVLARLAGEKGLFAVTPSRLWYVSEAELKSAPLTAIRKVSGRGGRLVIGGAEEIFIEAPVTGFDLDEVKVFFQQLKGYIKAARTGGLEAPPAAEPAAPEPEPEPEPAEAVAESPPLTPPEEPVSFPEPTPEEQPPLVPEPEPEVEAEPEPEMAPEFAEPAPAPAAPPAPRRHALALPLKLLSVLTALYALGLYFLYPTADPILLGGAVLFGLGFALVEWRVADL